MRLLLDTHTFLWFVTNDPLLSAAALALIADPTNEIAISPASYWEIAIKVSLGKYPLTVPFEQFFREGIDANDFLVLPVEIRHAAVLSSLPMHHKELLAPIFMGTALGQASLLGLFLILGTSRIAWRLIIGLLVAIPTLAIAAEAFEPHLSISPPLPVDSRGRP